MMNSAGHQLLLNCLETLQRALKGKCTKMSNRCVNTMKISVRRCLFNTHESPVSVLCNWSEVKL